jgi:ATP-dependent DNA helicase PIF1
MDKMFSNDQEIAFDLYRQGQNVFLTGPGGTGKSFLIHKMVEYSTSRGKSCQVCALTGCAAVLLECAKTIHSWSGIYMMNTTDEAILRRILNTKTLKQNWKTDVLIVDEVSMMSKRMFELLNLIGQKMRGNRRPFGGLQVVFVGDFFQLPPIEKDGFCFESKEWFQVFPKANHIELTTFFRQSDPTYIELLMQVRKGKLSPESIQVLETYVRESTQPITKVVPLRKQADFINQSMFDQLKTPVREFEAMIRTDMTTYPDGTKIERVLTTPVVAQEVEKLMKQHHLCKTLLLKKGAQVMCIRNIDMDHQICNGSQGIIVDIINDRPVVLFSNGCTKTMELCYYHSDAHPTIAIAQYPLVLAWAVTIHKIQGCTLSHAQIDIGASIFEYGQTYVALSRVKTKEGLYLLNFQPEKIKSNPKVIEFYDSLN